MDAKTFFTKRTLISVVFAVFFAVGCVQQQPEQKSKPLTGNELAKRGEYMVTAMGCGDCHTPWKMGSNGVPEQDKSRLLSGHPENAPHPTWIPKEMQSGTFAKTSLTFTSWAGPWGVSFTANLTPDVETGLGEWTEEAFIQAIRTGKHQGQPNGRNILPPMPWFAIKNLTDEDLKAVWAYLRSIPAVKNQVPLPIPPSS